MTATYTADVFATVDGFGAPKPATVQGIVVNVIPEPQRHRNSKMAKQGSDA